MTDIDLEKEVKDNPSSEADAPVEAPVVLTKAEKAARKKEATEAKKIQAAKDKKAADKVKADNKAIATVNTGLKPLITEGLKAMHMVGSGNAGWTIAAHKMRVLCKGTSVNFKDVAAEAFGVGKGTATKLANAGEMLIELMPKGEQAHEWVAHLPMGNINNLSTISRMTDKKIDKGIDLEFIRIDTTEALVNQFNNEYDDKGNPVLEHKAPAVPSTPAADEEDKAKKDDETVSDSETPAQFVARVTKGADDMNLSPKLRIKLAIALIADLKGKRIDDMYTALEVVFPAAAEEGEGE